VIFYTAHYHEREARTLADACGVSHVLTKPAEPEAILRTVDAALGVADAHASAPTAAEFDRDHLRLLTDKLSQKVDELRITNERLTALVDLGLELGSERDPQQLLQKFCHGVREIIGARYAIVGILDTNSLGLRYFFTSGMDAETANRLGSPDPGRGGPGTVFRESRCLRLHNPGGHPVAIDFPSSYPPLHSWLGAPIVSPSRVYGWLGLLNKVGAEAFSDEDERLAGTLAAQVGRIYENGSLYSDVLHHSMKLAEEVAERKLAESAVQRTADLLRAVAEGTTDALFVKDRDGKYLLFNEAAARFVGMSVAEVLGKDDTALFDPESARLLMNRDQQVMSSGAVVTEEETLTAAGITRTYLATKGPYRDKQGNVIGILGISRDITDRKRTEAALREAQQRLQYVVASSPAMLYTLAGEGENLQLTWISENVSELTGYTLAETFQPRWWHERVHHDDFPRVWDEIQKRLFADGRLVDEYRFRHSDGNYRWVRSEMRLIRDRAGQSVEIIGSWSDVTDRKQLEDQFRQAQKMEAIGRLAGGVAHDFNNLLTVINGYGELVLGALPAINPNRELVREIVAAGERAAGLTRQLLAFSRKAILKPKVLDLTTVVTDVERMLRRIVGEDIQLTVVSDPEVGAIKADPGQVEQVILNLVVNARDAMPTGGRLTIEVRNVELDETYARDHTDARPGSHVLLAVTDAGCGMDTATIARIFEPFFSTKGEHGTGLGLATVHGIVRQAGGHVAVYSEVGHGTTFKVYLPRVEQRPSLGKSHHNLALMPRGSETILLVEDEDGVRVLARRVLQSSGYALLEARDGAEAVRIAEEHLGQIDLLVTDVVMPRLDGRVVAERVTEMHPGIKVLFLSGYTDDAVVRHGILEAEVAFLQKPFTPTSLAAKIREVLDDEGNCNTD
jgi:PAS domain S-box-containing protein